MTQKREKTHEWKEMCGFTLLPAYVKENQLLCGLIYCWILHVTFSSFPDEEWNMNTLEDIVKLCEGMKSEL